MKPNPQQQAVISHVDGPCLVTAVPGSGKTASVTERTKNLISLGKDPSTILAITFTNKAAKEMRERIGKAVGSDAELMTISTFHSLCARILREHAPLVGLKDNFTIYDDDERERLLKTCIFRVEGEDFKGTDWYWNSILAYIEGRRNACMEHAKAVIKYRVKPNQVAVIAEYFKSLKSSNAIDFTGLLSETIRLLQKNPDVLEAYRKCWQYVSVDEVQDTNVAQYELIKLLTMEHKNILMVGDLDQCIPGDEPVATEDGLKRMDQVKVGDRVIAAKGRGLTGIEKVEHVAKRPYQGKLIKITTQSGAVIRATPNHILFGILRPLENKIFVYLMRRYDTGFRIGRAKGMRSNGKREVVGLQVRLNQEHADAMWVLRVCDTLEEASYYEAFYAAKFGIPTACFHCNGRGIAMSQGGLDRLFGALDTKARAMVLLDEMMLFEKYPHLVQASREVVGRPVITISMFGHKSQRAGEYAHLTTFHGESDELRSKFEEMGLKCTPSKRDLWRVRRVDKNYDAMLALTESMLKIDEKLTIRKKAFLSKVDGNSSVFTEQPAGHFHVGMGIAIMQHGEIIEDEVSKIETEDYDGDVYDLTIKNLHNFICGGVVCHNSVYAFRNASPENILLFEKDYGAKVLKLEKNYRSTPQILKYSQNLIEKNKLRKGTKLVTDNAEGEIPRLIQAHTDEDMAGKIADDIRLRLKGGTKASEIAILYRANHVSRVLELALRVRGIKYRVLGGQSFYDRKEIKGCLAILKMISNQNDPISFEKCCEMCCKGAGPKTVNIVLDGAAANNCSVLRSAKNVIDSGKSAGTKALEPLIQSYIECKGKPAHLALLHIAQKTCFWERMDADSTDSNDRCRNIDEMARDVEKFMSNPGASLSGYLQNVSLLSATDSDEPVEEIKMMTMHSCKGLEFDVVYLSHVNAGLIPHSRCVAVEDPVERGRQIEEERRLMYVGMTRARQRLTLAYCWAMGRKDCEPSPFLYETGLSVPAREALGPPKKWLGQGRY